MPEALGGISSLFSSIAPVLGGATAGAGLFGNVLNMVERGKETSNLQSAEKKYANLTPQQLSGMVTNAEAPLSQDLLQNVGNLVQADVASRGLAESPGVFASTETQAIAPYQQQQQQLALQLVMKQLGLPIEYAQAVLGSLGGPSNIAPLLQLLMKNGAGPTGGTPQSVPNDPTVGNILQQIIAAQNPSSPGLSSGGWTGDAGTLPTDTGAPA
jgi:hypothetical protein